ncbi:hypothetical protein CQW23_17430 [Capsicum baccatum]|uniref:Integrase catalytic domain-containing protein n=1 Tax=Capsicum baccatum TaxID=33114 RepID=A0A2G2WDT5_CAPBA|nr:hypothetical protein CQW23_17430 [Capsicum baccatum]
MVEIHSEVCDDLINSPPADLHAMSSPWPFVAWGMDVIGPIEPKTSNGNRFILVAIDYFTKWVEAGTFRLLDSWEYQVSKGASQRHCNIEIRCLSQSHFLQSRFGSIMRQDRDKCQQFETKMKGEKAGADAWEAKAADRNLDRASLDSSTQYSPSFSILKPQGT